MSDGRGGAPAAGRGARPHRCPAAGRLRRRCRCAILAALATRPLAMTGAESGVVADQLQYFAWIREAGESVVIRNVWDIDPDGTSYFVHPGFLVAGLIHQLGLSIPLVYLILWKPVAVGVVFFGFRAYVRRLLDGARRAAAALGDRALLRLAAGGGARPARDRRPRLPQGAPLPRGRGVPGRLRVGLPDDRDRRGARAVRAAGGRASACPDSGRGAAAPGTRPGRAAGALVISWLQPWQGVAVLATVAVVELLELRGAARAPGRRAARRPGRCSWPACCRSSTTGSSSGWTRPGRSPGTRTASSSSAGRRRSG